MEGEEEASSHTLVAPDEHAKRLWVTTITKAVSSLDRTDQAEAKQLLPEASQPASPQKVIVSQQVLVGESGEFRCTFTPF